MVSFRSKTNTNGSFDQTELRYPNIAKCLITIPISPKFKTVAARDGSGEFVVLHRTLVVSFSFPLNRIIENMSKQQITK